jgi:hypothetical protein
MLSSYPAFPIPPVALLNLCVEYPSLAPEQDEDPDGDEHVGETQQPPGRQVSPQLLDGIHEERSGEPPSAAPGKCPEPAEKVGEKGAEVVDKGRVVVRNAALLDRRRRLRYKAEPLW